MYRYSLSAIKSKLKANKVCIFRGSNESIMSLLFKKPNGHFRSAFHNFFFVSLVALRYILIKNRIRE